MLGDDAQQMRDLGLKGVYGPGSPMTQVVRDIEQMVLRDVAVNEQAPA